MSCSSTTNPRENTNLNSVAPCARRPAASALWVSVSFRPGTGSSIMLRSLSGLTRHRGTGAFYITPSYAALRKIFVRYLAAGFFLRKMKHGRVKYKQGLRPPRITSALAVVTCSERLPYIDWHRLRRGLVLRADDVASQTMSVPSQPPSVVQDRHDGACRKVEDGAGIGEPVQIAASAVARRGHRHQSRRRGGRRNWRRRGAGAPISTTRAPTPAWTRSRIS